MYLSSIKGFTGLAYQKLDCAENVVLYSILNSCSFKQKVTIFLLFAEVC